jgi:hypothetical protein
MKSLGHHVNALAARHVTQQRCACSLFTLPCTAGDGHHANSERAARAHVGRASGWPPRCMLHTPPAHPHPHPHRSSPLLSSPLLSSPVKQTLSHLMCAAIDVTPLPPSLSMPLLPPSQRRLLQPPPPGSAKLRVREQGKWLLQARQREQVRGKRRLQWDRA